MVNQLDSWIHYHLSQGIQSGIFYQYIKVETHQLIGNAIMKFSKSIYLLIIILLSSTSYQAFAQPRHQDRDRGRQIDREQQIDREMSRDRDRDQDRTKDSISDHMGGAIYGHELMTNGERTRYREQLKAAPTDDMRNEIRSQYQKKMQERELNKAQYQDGLGSVIYGAGLMTEQERNRYRNQIRAATSERQRNEIRLQHQKEIDLREQMIAK